MKEGKEDFEKLAAAIADWHKATFPNAKEAGQVLKLDEEFNEFAASSGSIDELADCFIVASALAGRYKNPLGMFVLNSIVQGSENELDALYNAVVLKMRVNQHRVWTEDGKGSYHHEEENG